MFKKVGIICSSLLMSFTVQAKHYQHPLDTVGLVVNAEQWVKTDSAKLEVTINATLTKTSLTAMRQNILLNLSNIAKGEWHITQFNRSQDNSGLEKLYVQAQARVNQSLLPGINAKAKSLTKPGIRYQVTNIDFSPSKLDIQKVMESVRQDLYTKIQTEIKVLNKQFKDQSYSLYRVQIMPSDQVSQQPQRLNRMMKSTVAFAADSYSANISVSNKVKLTALVALASNRNTQDK